MGMIWAELTKNARSHIFTHEKKQKTTQVSRLVYNQSQIFSCRKFDIGKTYFECENSDNTSSLTLSLRKK